MHSVSLATLLRSWNNIMSRPSAKLPKRQEVQRWRGGPAPTVCRVLDESGALWSRALCCVWATGRPCIQDFRQRFTPVGAACLSSRYALLALTIALTCQFSASVGGEPDVAQPSDLPGVPDATWDRLFTRTEGWTGGDVAGTVDLGSGRTLWLFGDSWIGSVAAGRHAPGSKMVNNSIAIQAYGSSGPSNEPIGPPESAEIHFHAGKDTQGHPAAWIVPQTAATEANANASATQPAGWYWPSGGGLVVPGPGDTPRLLVFLFHVGKREGRDGVWAFKSLGCSMALIDDFRQPVEKWRTTQFDIPFAIDADHAAADHALHESNWGVAAYRQCAADAGPANLYVYGTRDLSPRNRQLVLARMPADAPQQFHAWRFYAGNDRWSPRAEDAVAIADNIVSELSVEELRVENHRTLLMVHSEPVFGRHVLVRTASHPEGPWSKPRAVYAVPEVEHNRVYFTYAAKGHLQLSPPGELLISYLVNAHDFGAMFNDASIYRPRFIRVPLNAILKDVLQDR
jgi:hypothetical protein